MNPNESQYQKIESFLNNQMSKNDREAFLNELKADNDFKKQFQIQKLEHEIMESFIATDLRSDLDQWKKEQDENLLTKEENIRRIPFYRKSLSITIAASVTLLIAALLWLNLNQTKEGSSIVDNTIIERPVEGETKTVENQDKVEPIKEEIVETDNKITTEIPKQIQPKKKPSQKANKYLALANSHYQPFDFDQNSTIRGEEDSQEILDKLSNGDLSGAAKLLEAKEPLTPDDLFMLAMIKYNQKKFNQAITYSDRLVKDHEEYLYYEEAQWKLAISLLFNEDQQKSTRLLASIVKDDEHEFYDVAQDLLNKIIDID